MHENVRPDAGVDWQAGQKLAVGLWDCADQCVLERLKPQATLVQEIVYIDAVGQKRLAAPKSSQCMLSCGFSRKSLNSCS